MEIKQAQKSDLDQLVLLFDLYRQFYKQKSDVLEAKAFLSQRFDRDESIVYVAADSDQLVGFTQIYPIWSSVRMKPLWLLNDLYVTKEYRGKHIGESLMNKAIEMAQKHDACGVTLETGVSNTVGQSLYEKLGFNKVTNEFHYALDF